MTNYVALARELSDQHMVDMNGFRDARAIGCDKSMSIQPPIPESDMEEFADQFRRAIEFLSSDHCNIKLKQWPKHAFSSYSLKHRAEKACPPYICNGALIIAGLHLGIPMRRDYRDLNCWFKLSVKQDKRRRIHR